MRPSGHHQKLVALLISLSSLQTELAKYAEDMGAVHRYDLTLDVTHLIVGDYNTPKYRYVARERSDVRPMTAKWIEAIRELWINDEEIDMKSLEQEHILPTFRSLKFSMTGCDDRKKILP
jgi:DNA replication regulator DPB11